MFFPDRWAGDPCICAWGGKHNVYENNTCVVGTSTNTMGQHVDPIGLDTYPYSGPAWGFVCHLDFRNATLTAHTAQYAANRYFTPLGDWVFACPDNSTYASSGIPPRNHTLHELQAEGWEANSTVAPREALPAAQMIAMARRALQLPMPAIES